MKRKYSLHCPKFRWSYHKMVTTLPGFKTDRAVFLWNQRFPYYWQPGLCCLTARSLLSGGKLILVCLREGKHAKRFPFWRERGTIRFSEWWKVESTMLECRKGCKCSESFFSCRRCASAQPSHRPESYAWWTGLQSRGSTNVGGK